MIRPITFPATFNGVPITWAQALKAEKAPRPLPTGTPIAQILAAFFARQRTEVLSYLENPARWMPDLKSVGTLPLLAMPKLDHWTERMTQATTPLMMDYLKEGSARWLREHGLAEKAFDPNEPRDAHGQWTSGGGTATGPAKPATDERDHPYATLHKDMVADYKTHEPLTPEQSEAVKGYAANPESREINEALRMGDSVESLPYDYAKTAQGLDDVIAKNRTDRAAVVHRGMVVGNDDNFTLPKAGDTFVDRGFVSTTMHSPIARQYSDTGDLDNESWWEGRQPAGVYFSIVVPRGSNAYVVGALGDDAEKEIILPRNSQFRIESVTTTEVNGRQTHTIQARYIGTAQKSLASMTAGDDYDRFVWKSSDIMLGTKALPAPPVTAIGARQQDLFYFDPTLVNPHLQHAARSLSLDFCAETNATTSLKLSKALATLRRSLAAGLIAGDPMKELVGKVKEIFTEAEEFRAKRIAVTESSRAIHRAEIITAKETGVPMRKFWLIAADACDDCVEVSHRFPQGVPADADFGHSKSKNPAYAIIHAPPDVHPGCQCSLRWSVDGGQPTQ